MNLGFFGKLCRLAATGVILICSSSCIEINEHLGQNFIPDNQKWTVYVPAPVEFGVGDVVMQMSDSLSAYSSKRFTFGTVRDEMGICRKSTSMTLVPVDKNISFGEKGTCKVKNFHFTAVRDTLSVSKIDDISILQNIYVHPLKKHLDSTIRYTGEFMDKDKLNEFVDFSRKITVGTPIYDGGDSLSFNFSNTYAQSVIDGIESIAKDKRDSLDYYLKAVPGIHITTEDPVSDGGRFNMFELPLKTDRYGYVTGNFAKLSLTADYGDRKQVDTSFLFLFGPVDFVSNSSNSLPGQLTFNSSSQEYATALIRESEIIANEEIKIEGGSGYKPVIKAEAIRNAVENIIRKELNDPTIKDFSNIVINRATLNLPFDMNKMDNGWSDVDMFPKVLNPTVRLRSKKGNHVTYAGLTDSSIKSANQGNINRSNCVYNPDISHHVQELLKLDKSSDAYSKNISKYDIWMLIMHEEVTVTQNNNSNNDFYNNMMYNSYYNNMMYDPYGYGGYYGGGYGGYYGGYGGYGGYGYNNYINYMMMAQMASGPSTSTQTSTELDKDRYYKCVLNGPTAPQGKRPSIKITFSIPDAE